jgi:hypothetical protein
LEGNEMTLGARGGAGLAQGDADWAGESGGGEQDGYFLFYLLIADKRP